MKRKTPSPVTVRSGQIEFLRTNSRAWEARDLYRTVLGLSWPRFALVTFGVYGLINLMFAGLYLLGGDCIAGVTPVTFSKAFFFSVQTLSTVGFGHLYPTTLYSNIVTTIEIVIGMFFTAVVTGLIFVRFSRPVARLLFSRKMVIRQFDGMPSLQIRVANLQRQPMVEAEFRLMLIRKEQVPEEGDVRRFYELKLEFERLVMFPSAITIRHRIDETSPLHGVTPDLLEDWSARFFTSIVCTDTVIQAPVQSQHDYMWRDVHFAHRFVEIYHERDDGRMEVDYGRVHDIELDPYQDSP